jgi:hypothetical protein
MSAWKAWERYVAEILGGVRRGPLVSVQGEEGRGHNDIAGLEGRYSVECKHGASIGYALILEACDQAFLSSEDDEIPIAAIHKKGTPFGDAIFCIRLKDWQRLRLSVVCGTIDGDGEEEDSHTLSPQADD